MPLQWMGGTYPMNPKKDQPQLRMPTTERQRWKDSQAFWHYHRIA